MATNVSAAVDPDYEYLNEHQILPELICAICRGPFESPVSIDGCEHAFCEQCILIILRRSKKCPICRQRIKSSSIRRGYSRITTRIVHGQLNALRVRCKLCNQTDIQRGEWKNHEDTCQKKRVQCQSAHHQCPWEGTRDSLTEHLQVCQFESLRPAFDQMENKSKSTITRLEAKVDALTKNVAFLLNITNHGNLMRKGCRNPKQCPYYDQCNRKATFICINCKKGVYYENVSLHACSGGYICRSCVESQYPSNTNNSRIDTDSSPEISEAED